MAHRYPAWAERMKSETTPIITCRAYPEYPSAVAYPLDDVMNCVMDDWFTNTVAYAIGYAILTQVEEIYLFGCDFMYPGSHVVEPGADCCSYLLGLATGRGVKWKLPMTSTLMDSHLCQQDKEGKLARPLYGYDYNPGDCRSKVEAGTASELEKLLARKAPHKVQEITDGTRTQAHQMGKGQPHGATRRGQGDPHGHPQHAGSIQRTPAGWQGVPRERDGVGRPAAVGEGADGIAWPRPSAPSRVDGSGEERIELALSGHRDLGERAPARGH